jgi:hypothetical protein
MFQDPQYQFSATALSVSSGTSPVDFPEIQSGLAAATPNSAPTFRSGTNRDFIEYDGTDDSHNFDSQDGSVTGDVWSVASVCRLNNGDSPTAVFSWGSSDTARFEATSGGVTIQIQGVGDPGQFGNVPIGSFFTMGVSFNTGDYNFYLNGSNVGSQSSGTPDQVSSGSIGLGFHRSVTKARFNGDIAEVIISNTEEPGTAFSQFNADRI